MTASSEILTPPTAHSDRSPFGTLGLASLTSLGVAAAASAAWLVLLAANQRAGFAVPWAAAAMAVYLGGYWWYLGGHGWPARTQATRRHLLRARLVPARQFAWSLGAGALALVALAGLWIVLERLAGGGGNPTSAAFAGYPLYVVVPILVVASLVSPLSEEAAFRGYAQTILERRFRPLWAVAVSSLLFALWHGPTQGFFWWKLLFFFAVGVVFGTIAYLTGSTLPAIPVHIAGDLLFFVVIWPHDAARPLVFAQGADLSFWASGLQALAFAALAVWAFRRLALSRRASPSAPGGRSRR